MLNLIYATRTSSWEMYLSCVKEVILGLFLIIATSMPATSFHFSMTCAAYLSPCQKSTEHLKVANCLFRWAEIILFGRHEAEKTIENTINRDYKAGGGYIGFSASLAATRWSLFLKLLREHLSVSPHKAYVHKELAPAQIKTDLEALGRYLIS